MKTLYFNRKKVEKDIADHVSALSWGELSRLYTSLDLSNTAEPEMMMRVQVKEPADDKSQDKTALEYTQEKIDKLGKEMEAELAKPIHTSTGTDGEDDIANIHIET